MREYPTGGYTTVNGGRFSGKTDNFMDTHKHAWEAMIDSVGAEPDVDALAAIRLPVVGESPACVAVRAASESKILADMVVQELGLQNKDCSQEFHKFFEDLGAFGTATVFIPNEDEASE